ncbi:MAG: aldehyde ferredoxin oxidoreductase, partial [Spirochaetales bacterium]
PAGENLVRFAAIMNDADRAAARSGIGAVMGSKNLKAVAIRGTKGVRVADAEEFLRPLLISKHVKKADLGIALEEFGTPLFVDIMNANNAMPTKNFKEGFFDDGDLINGAEMIDKTLVRSKACFGCSLNCGRNTRLPADSPYSGRGDGPEYETIFALGSNILVNDIFAVTKMNYICNEMGIDTMDAGSTIAAIMELVELGKLSEKEIGYPVEWGDAEASMRLLEDIAMVRGFGKIAALGGRHVAEKYGAPEVFMGSKGQGFAGYHPRAMVGQGLLYATSPEGGNHTTGNTVQQEINGIPEPMDPFTAEGKAELVIRRQNETAFVECCGVCVFPYMLIEGSTQILAELYSAAVGKKYTEAEVRVLGERAFNVERLFNQKLGFNRKDDTLPKRLTQEPHNEGIGEGNVVPLDEMLDEYYRLRGWDKNGMITEKKLRELSLA